MADLSKTQIDRLGDRLRKGNINEEDLKMLDAYRKSFGPAYQNVIQVIRGKLELEPTGRPAKSTISIVDKLLRESIRLSQLQDIAGCRVVVKDIQEQNHALMSIQNAFSSVIIVDRRIKPNHGYRAIHLIVKTEAKLVEIQLRTELQHHWAEHSERFSDKIDPLIKYGGGNKVIQDYLLELSKDFEKCEKLEVEIINSSQGLINQSQRSSFEKIENELKQLKLHMIENITKFQKESL